MVDFKSKNLLVAAVSLATAMPLSGHASSPSCPTGWMHVSGACRPDLATTNTDYYQSSANDNYPVCGPGRIPVKRLSQGWTTLDLASSLTPRTTLTANLGPGGTVSFAAPVTAPTYFYNGYPRCMCASKNYSATPKVDATPAQLPGTVTGGALRFNDDSIQTVSATSAGATEVANRYSPVAISRRHGGTTDGRLGVEFQSGKSFCGCPNFNEEPVPVIEGTSEVIGAYCRPRVRKHAVLKTFYPGAHDPSSGETKIMDRAQELDENNELITQMPLPDSTGSPASSQTYVRKIWDCASPYNLNTATGNCEMSFTYHAPGPGSPPTIPPSAVSPRVRGSTPAAQWQNTINKKFAACLNGFGTTTDMTLTNTIKFDCISNSMVSYKDFDALWASTDVAGDGGLLNAVVLANAVGQPISGFYTQEGKHCDQYSEFAGSLDYAIVNPKMGNTSSTALSQVTQLGKSIPLPGSNNGGGSSAYDQMKTDVTQLLHKRIPVTADERRECPILVRAAAVYSCPEPKPSGGLVVYQEVDPGDPTKLLRAQCPTAKDIKIHMRIEQLTEIKGHPKMPTIDTITNSSANSAVSIQRIIAEKYGVSCPAGTGRNEATGACEPQ
jgi:hypothetical protein